MLRERIILNNHDNLNIREFKRKYFEMPWHCHSEYELVYIISGSGKKFVGEAMQTFENDDLTFIGPDTPHFFLADDKFFEDNQSYCHWWVVQFSENIFPKIFEDLDAFNSISKILSLSHCGIHFLNQEIKKQTISSIKSMGTMNGLNRIIALYKILNFLSLDQSFVTLCTEKPESELDTKDDIIKTVYRYLLNNFKENIQLDTLAELVNMRVTTLCSYYKRLTLKSIIASLNEIRLNHACYLIVNTHLDINQIAYESGFRNISNFNRQFLKHKNVSPKNYRKVYKKITSPEIEDTMVA